MTLRQKTLLFTSVLLALLVILIFVVAQMHISRGIERIERDEVEEEIARTVDILDESLRELNAVNADWAIWNNTYDFIENSNPSYVQDNLTQDTFKKLRIHLVLFVHSSGRVPYGRLFDFESNTESPAPDSMIAMAIHLASHAADTTDGVSCIAFHDDMPIQLTLRPILKTDGGGPSRGTLVFGRLLNDQEQSHLGKLARHDFTIQPIDSPAVPEAVRQQLRAEPGLAAIVWPNREIIRAYSNIKPSDNPPLVLSLDMPRTIYVRGKEMMRYFLVSLLALGALIIASVLSLLSRRILNPLGQLSRQVDEMGIQNTVSARVTSPGGHELDRLAGAINEMMARIETARVREEEAEHRKEKMTSQLRAIVENVEKLIACDTADDLFRKSVEFVRDHLGAERCAIFVNMPDGFRGTYGTDIKGQTTDEHNHLLTKVPEWSQGHPDPDKVRWNVQEGPLYSWDGTKEIEVGTGWTACTLIARQANESIAVFSHDNAILHAPFDPVKQEIIGVFCGLLANIIERKRTEEELRRAREEWERTFDAVPDLICLLDPQHHIIRANRAMAERIGLSPAACEGQLCSMCVHLTDTPPNDCPLSALLKDNREKTVEARLEHLKGDFLVSVSPLFNSRGELASIVHVAREITALKQAEKKLADQFSFLQTVLDAVPSPIFYKDLKRRYIGCNNSFQAFLGKTREEIIGKTTAEVLPAEHVHKHLDMDADLFESGTTQTYEYVIRHGDGTLRNVVFYNAVFRNPDGAQAGIVGAILDITEQKKIMNNLETVNRFMTGREERMLELKNEVNALLAELKREKKYGV